MKLNLGGNENLRHFRAWILFIMTIMGMFATKLNIARANSPVAQAGSKNVWDGPGVTGG